MKKKVILICVDGMRADSVLKCGNPYAAQFMRRSTYTLSGRTVYPSSTYPCHVSMFHSVPPEVHGTLVWYEPSQTPVKGLCEHVHEHGGRCGAFMGCEPVEECVAHPEQMGLTVMMHLDCYASPDSDGIITRRMLEDTRRFDLDFVFLYLGQSDSKGHRIGWMSDEYLAQVGKAWENIEKVEQSFGGEYTIIVTTDHGGHEKSHGTRMDEDMVIPLFFLGEDFAPGRELEGASIMDIPPTVADVMGIPPSGLWQGRSVLRG